MPKRKKRHSDAEIASKLAEAASLAAQGKNQSEIAQALGVSVMTLHRWRKANPNQATTRSHLPEPNISRPGPELSEPERRARISELQVENTRLRKLVTDLLLEKIRLEEELGRSGGLAISRKTRS